MTTTKNAGTADHLACALCGDRHPFEMPEALVDAALRGDLVIFAGAGISTESRTVFRDSFFETISSELDNPAGLNFPDAMSRYERQHGRASLLKKIRARFDYVNGFWQLKQDATQFHFELGTAFFLDTIFTTNWDTYFEDIAAATPIVVPEDYAFWDLPGRKVLKLHGSMNNLGTLVITKSDYDRCYRRLRDGVIGSSLRHLLATKQAVFIGYSFGDPDLNRILRFLRREMADILPDAYVVTPHGAAPGSFPTERTIRTDGTYFISRLKEAAVARGAMHPDSIYDRASSLRERLDAAYSHLRRVNIVDSPSAVHAFSYLDGLRHALERIVSLRSSGYYSNPHTTLHLLHTYEAARRGAIRKRRYYDAAYIEGYLNGFFSVEVTDEEVEDCPLFFVWGSDKDLVGHREFRSELARAPELHKASTAEAKRMVKRLGPDLLPLHTPFLDIDLYLNA